VTSKGPEDRPHRSVFSLSGCFICLHVLYIYIAITRSLLWLLHAGAPSGRWSIACYQQGTSCRLGKFSGSSPLSLLQPMVFTTGSQTRTARVHTRARARAQK
jgi:hypothetical protein